MPLLLALAPVYLTDALDQDVDHIPVVVLPAIVGLLLGLRLVSGLARERGTGMLGTIGLAIFLSGVVALSLIDALDEALGTALGLGRIDLGVLELSSASQIVMILLLPMGFGFSLVNVAANAILNTRVPVGMQGRVFALQTLVAGVAAILPLLTGGALTEVLDVCVVLGLTPVLLVFAWTWARWGSPDPREAWRRRRAQRSAI